MPEHERGNILSVTDLKRILGLPHETLTEKTMIVAIEPGIVETGLLVDEISEAIVVPISKIEPPLSTIAPEMAEYREGQCKGVDMLIALINGGEIFEKRVEIKKTRNEILRYELQTNRRARQIHKIIQGLGHNRYYEHSHLCTRVRL